MLDDPLHPCLSALNFCRPDLGNETRAGHNRLLVLQPQTGCHSMGTTEAKCLVKQKRCDTTMERPWVETDLPV